MQAEERPTVPLSQRVFGELVYWITIVACIICIVAPLVVFIDMDNNVLNPQTLFNDIFEGKPAASEVKIDRDVAPGDTVIYLDKLGDFEDAVDKLRDKSGVELTADAVAGATVLQVAEMGDFIGLEDDEMILIEDEDFEEVAAVLSVDEQAGTITIADGLLNRYSMAADGEVTVIDEPVLVVEDDTDTEKQKLALRALDKDNDAVMLMAPVSSAYIADEHAVLGEETVWEDAADDVEDGHFWIDNLDTGDGLAQFGIALGCAVGFFALLGAAFVYIFKEKSYGWAIGALWVALMIAVSVLGIVSLH